MLKSITGPPPPPEVELEPVGLSSLPRGLLGESSSATAQFKASFNSHHSPPPAGGHSSRLSQGAARFPEVRGGWRIVPRAGVWPPRAAESPQWTLSCVPFQESPHPGVFGWAAPCRFSCSSFCGEGLACIVPRRPGRWPEASTQSLRPLRPATRGLDTAKAPRRRVIIKNDLSRS